MAIPSTRNGFRDYCKRALGFGVIDINVSDEQVEDRIDEGLQYFAQYHYDGVERMYLKYKVTEDDVTRARSNETTTSTDTKDGNVTGSFLEGKNYIPMPSPVVSVIQVFPFDNQVTNNMFDIRYQLRLNDLSVAAANATSNTVGLTSSQARYSLTLHSFIICCI